MNKNLSVAVSLILLFVFSLFVTAQNKPEVLTNEKIIQLINLGLSEDVIVEKIHQSECRCDTSTNGLAKLKAAKVSDAIILAMLNSSPGSYSETPSPTNRGNSKNKDEDNTVSSVNSKSTGKAESLLRKISEPGIYLFENGEMKQIEPSVFSGGKINPLMSTLTYGIKKTKFRAKVRGKSANLQTSNSKPEFYFVFNPEFKNSGATMAGLFWGMPATSPAEFLMVQMNQKDASREAVLGEYGVWTGASMGARDKDIREYSFEKLKPGVYKVVPKNDLTNGEYCFYYAGNVTGIGFAGGKVFDFSVVK
jgi:hypothetical protein